MGVLVVQAKINNYSPSVNQQKLHSSDAKEILIVSPIRSGKSYSLKYDIIKNAWNNTSGMGVLVCAPVYRMLVDILERDVTTWFYANGLVKSHSYATHTTTLLNGNIIYYRSLEDPDNALRGLNVSRIYIDEAAYVSEYAMQVVRGRALTINAPIILATTPKGVNSWVYNYYFKNGKRPEVEYIKYSLRDNPLLTEEAIQRLYESYDNLMALQELEAEFVNLAGSKVYYSFDDESIISDSDFRAMAPQNTLEIVCGLDYNVSINAMVFMSRMPDGRIVVHSEKTGCKTLPEVADYMMSHYGQQLTIVDDAASGTNRNILDLKTPRDYFRQRGLWNIIERTSNSSVSKRHADVNSAFKNALGNRMLYVTENCKSLIGELQGLSYKQNKDEIDTRSNTMGHISDALGYALQYLKGDGIANIQPNNPFAVFQSQSAGLF